MDRDREVSARHADLRAKCKENMGIVTSDDDDDGGSWAKTGQALERLNLDWYRSSEITNSPRPHPIIISRRVQILSSSRSGRGHASKGERLKPVLELEQLIAVFAGLCALVQVGVLPVSRLEDDVRNELDQCVFTS